MDSSSSEIQISVEFYLYGLVLGLTVLVVCLALCLIKIALSIFSYVCNLRNVGRFFRTTLTIAILFFFWSSVISLKKHWHLIQQYVVE